MLGVRERLARLLISGRFLALYVWLWISQQMTRIDTKNPSIEKLKRASIFKVQYNRELLLQDEIQKRKIAADRMNKV